MPKKIPEYLTYFLEDCLQGDPDFSLKSMFGGFGVYKNKKIFAIYAFDEIYFKVGENNIEDYKKYGSHIFEYDKAGKKMNISYYTVPEEILENREELDKWIEKSLEVKSKTTTKKKSKKNIELDKRILEALLEIPKGKVSTYKILADKFGVHSRRIASVMKTNSQPDIYPCYKVISHSGKISGYSGPDGVNSKVNMLENDGVIIKDGKIEKKYWHYYK